MNSSNPPLFKWRPPKQLAEAHALLAGLAPADKGMALPEGALGRMAGGVRPPRGVMLALADMVPLTVEPRRRTLLAALRVCALKHLTEVEQADAMALAKGSPEGGFLVDMAEADGKEGSLVLVGLSGPAAGLESRIPLSGDAPAAARFHLAGKARIWRPPDISELVGFIGHFEPGSSRALLRATDAERRRNGELSRARWAERRPCARHCPCCRCPESAEACPLSPRGSRLWIV